MSFTHLHVHTQYSLLDGEARVSELVARTKALGMDSLAITDHGVLYGIVDFYKQCQKEGIKPIIGIEAYVAKKSMQIKEGAREYSHLILLAKNNDGIKNLMRLSSLAFTEGFYYKPRIDYDLLEAHSDGLICMSACLAGDIPTLLLHNMDEAAYALARRLVSMFAEDFYIEIQNHGIAEQLAVLPKLVKLAHDLNIKLVATNDIHYLERADAKYQDILLCVQTSTYIDDENRMRMSSEEFYLKSEDEMRAAFPEYPEAIDNTREIVDKCNVSMDFSHRYMPVFVAPDGMDNITFLNKLCNEGLVFRGMENNQEARTRLDYEISVITQMGFVDYFLIVYDFINFARQNGIMIGPGRGSGVGSLVAYCLRITDVDPLKYNLLFERLLNPERVSMPDIDVDMCIERRQEVIDYVANKYGQDHVAQIGTFGTLKAKAVIKDVGRALRIPLEFVDRMNAFVPRGIDISLSKAVEESPELANLVRTDENAAKIYECACKLEGLQRHASTHAAGVVIAPLPITEFVPLQVTKGVVSTQFVAGTVEEMGLLKMDFLGLRTLTVIRYTLELIKSNKKEVPDLDNMTYDDKNVYAMLSRADTAAVFQLESGGMRQFLTQLKPECFEDIIAGISLYRPGPMDRIPDYLRGKADKSKIKYADERLRPILEPTYGVIVYQEQVMQIVRDLAGYSMGRSDLVRRAMAKKKFDVMEKERKNFVYGIEEDGEIKVAGALRNGVDKKVAEKLFDEMMDFASYAFNKSHAAAYAVVAYKTAYLKHYFPREFMTATINSFLSSTDKVAEYVYMCKARGITVLPPDINRSGVKFTTEGDSIRLGFVAIKNIGENAVELIVEEREKNGAYKDFIDFVERVPGLTKRLLEGLIMAGAFLSLGHNRAQLMAVYEQVLAQVNAERDKREGGQMLLFDLLGEAEKQSVNVKIPQMHEYDEKTLSKMEIETMGMHLTKHPLNDYLPAIEQMTITASEIANADDSSERVDGEIVTMGCVVHATSRKKTKAGTVMMTGSLEDLTGLVEFLAFPAIYAKYAEFLVPDAILSVKGKLSLSEERGNAIIILEAKRLENPTRAQRLYIKFTDRTQGMRDETLEILKKFPGNIEVLLYNEVTGEKVFVPNKMRVNGIDDLLSELSALLGSENIILKQLEK